MAARLPRLNGGGAQIDQARQDWPLQPALPPPHTQGSFPPFLPEVGKTPGLPQLFPVAPPHLWAEAPEPHGQQPKAKVPQDDLLAGSEAAEAINSSGAPILGPVGPSVVVMGAGEGEGNWGGAQLQGPPKLWHGVLPAATAPPSQVGLASSQRPLEDTGIEGRDFGQARGGEGVLVLVSVSQAV